MDPRTTSVVYKDTILKSVEKTSRLVIEDEIYALVSKKLGLPEETIKRMIRRPGQGRCGV